jgi:predicted TIM-barrel fold metal-dependent hydrolase
VRQLIDQIGSAELLLYGSDYPHRYAHGNDELLAALSPEQAEQIRCGNAAAWYRLDERVPAARV